MKKCKWCSSNIDDNAIVCPHCKAKITQESVFPERTNHVEKFLEKHPNGRTTPIWKREEKQLIIKCPTCGSANTRKITSKTRFDSIFFLGIFSNKINKSFECKNCGYTW